MCWGSEEGGCWKKRYGEQKPHRQAAFARSRPAGLPFENLHIQIYAARNYVIIETVQRDWDESTDGWKDITDTANEHQNHSAITTKYTHTRTHRHKRTGPFYNTFTL